MQLQTHFHFLFNLSALTEKMFSSPFFKLLNNSET